MGRRVCLGSSELAILYSDQSVLEMHHLASAFQLMQRPECGMLASLGDEHRKEVRTRLVAMVLATDLSANFQIINTFKQMLTDKTAEVEAKLAGALSEGGGGGGGGATTATPGGGGATMTTPSASANVGASSSCSTSGASPSGADKDRGTTPLSAAKEAVIGKLMRRGSSELESAQTLSGAATPAGTGEKTPMRRRTSGPSGKLRELAMLSTDPTGGPLLHLTPSDQLLVLKMVLKVSDIGNVTKGRAYCLRWTERICAEFFNQGDLEAKMKLPVTPMMDRKAACIPKQQVPLALALTLTRARHHALRACVHA